MATQPRVADRRRFDGYELYVGAGELRKHGVRLRLRGPAPPGPEILLDRYGEVVTRAEFQSQIWTADTFFDFDHSLDNAIARIRGVLGDSAETPRGSKASAGPHVTHLRPAESRAKGLETAFSTAT